VCLGSPRKDVVISTKDYAENLREVKKSLESSLKELNTDYINIFLLNYVKLTRATNIEEVMKIVIKTADTEKIRREEMFTPEESL
jgi:diketogulonate reductase-like aldo/keto reductase